MSSSSASAGTAAPLCTTLQRAASLCSVRAHALQAACSVTAPARRHAGYKPGSRALHATTRHNNDTANICGALRAGRCMMLHADSCAMPLAGIERFTVAHDRGSSHGLSRIIRMAYWEHPDYVPLLRRAYELWRKLEAETHMVLTCSRPSHGVSWSWRDVMIAMANMLLCRPPRRWLVDGHHFPPELPAASLRSSPVAHKPDVGLGSSHHSSVTCTDAHHR